MTIFKSNWLVTVVAIWLLISTLCFIKPWKASLLTQVQFTPLSGHKWVELADHFNLKGENKKRQLAINTATQIAHNRGELLKFIWDRQIFWKQYVKVRPVASRLMSLKSGYSHEVYSIMKPALGTKQFVDKILPKTHANKRHNKTTYLNTIISKLKHPYDFKDIWSSLELTDRTEFVSHPRVLTLYNNLTRKSKLLVHAMATEHTKHIAFSGSSMTLPFTYNEGINPFCWINRVQDSASLSKTSNLLSIHFKQIHDKKSNELLCYIPIHIQFPAKLLIDSAWSNKNIKDKSKTSLFLKVYDRLNATNRKTKIKTGSWLKERIHQSIPIDQNTLGLEISIRLPRSTQNKHDDAVFNIEPFRLSIEKQAYNLENLIHLQK